MIGHTLCTRRMKIADLVGETWVMHPHVRPDDFVFKSHRLQLLIPHSFFDYKNYKTDGAVSRNVFWQKRLRCSGITKAEQLLAPPPFPPVFPDEDEEGWERLDVATWPGVGSCSFGILLYACSSICQFHLSLDCCMYMLCQV